MRDLIAHKSVSLGKAMSHLWLTTGPLTILLIKRVGYPAAFLMVEYVGVSYFEVLKHALISAMVSYLGLLYIVHLEAEKANLRGLPRRHVPRWQ